jgi:hypothetical protein
MASFSLEKDTYFWLLLPIFVALSGNLTPFRIGPVLPIFVLLAVFVGLNFVYVLKYASGHRYFLIGAIGLSLYFVAFTLLAIPSYALSGNEFFGATNPTLYATFSFLRYVLSISVLIILAHKTYATTGQIYKSMFAAYVIILIPLLIQSIIYALFGVEFGFIFHTGGSVRFGGLIGEPQTISAWLFSIFYFLYATQGREGFPNSTTAWTLLLSQVIVLALTASTAWILAFGVFIFLRLNNAGRLLALIMVGLVVAYSSLTILGKITGELFGISERSITVIAGFEVFISSIHRTLFGYGLGLSPYLLGGTEIFKLYPDLNLSDLGRQDVMNSYLEILFELGVIGAPIFFYLFINAANLRTWSTLVRISPLLIGIFGIGGGFFAGYLLLGIPLISRLYEGTDTSPYRLKKSKAYRLTPVPAP